MNILSHVIMQQTFTHTPKIFDFYIHRFSIFAMFDMNNVTIRYRLNTHGFDYLIVNRIKIL